MSYKIPLFDLNFDEEEEKAVIDVIRSRWISSGPKTKEFEQLFAEKLNAKHCVALTNCTSALHLAMKLTGVEQGDEVICPSLTFVATANAVKYVGAIPVFADIKSIDDLNIDPADVERKITSRTKAIIVMHYAGFPCNMNRITEIAMKHNLKVIEDACHGPLSEYQGKKLGTIGDIGCFSFFSNKNISTGEGGMLVTGCDLIADEARLLRSHGMTSMSYDRSKGHSSDYDVIKLGYNYRLDDIRASIGITQLKKLEKDLQRRSDIRRSYISQLASVSEISIPFSDNTEYVSNYIFPFVLKNSTVAKRDLVREALSKNGIQTSIHYPAVHRFKIYNDVNRELPVTDYVTDNTITLPMYGSLSEDNIVEIVTSVKGAISG